MFYLNKNTIDKLSEEGIYDFFMDIEDEGSLLPEDKETIYQHTLLYLQDSLGRSEMKGFLRGLNRTLLSKIEVDQQPPQIIPFIIKFSNIEKFKNDFIHTCYCGSPMSIFNEIYNKIMEDYLDKDMADGLFGKVIFNAYSRGIPGTFGFKFDLKFEENKNGQDVCTITYLDYIESVVDDKDDEDDEF